jgi:hypothetical protein
LGNAEEAKRKEKKKAEGSLLCPMQKSLHREGNVELSLGG